MACSPAHKAPSPPAAVADPRCPLLPPTGEDDDPDLVVSRADGHTTLRCHIEGQGEGGLGGVDRVVLAIRARVSYEGSARERVAFTMECTVPCGKHAGEGSDDDLQERALAALDEAPADSSPAPAEASAGASDTAGSGQAAP